MLSTNNSYQKEEFLEDSAQSDLFIFGENHYHHCIQQAEAEGDKLDCKRPRTRIYRWNGIY